MENKIEVNGLHYGKNAFAINYEPLFKFLDGQSAQLKDMNMLEVCKLVYTFGNTYSTIAREEANARIAYLTEQNIKWCNRALEAEVVNDRLRLCAKEQQENNSTPTDLPNGSDISAQTT